MLIRSALQSGFRHAVRVLLGSKNDAIDLCLRARSFFRLYTALYNHRCRVYRYTKAVEFCNLVYGERFEKSPSGLAAIRVLGVAKQELESKTLCIIPLDPSSFSAILSA